jgi:hypothetical protein
MAKSKSSKSSGKGGAKAPGVVRKDLAIAERIARWLIVIAISGIALTVLIATAAAVVFATVIAPRIELLATRLRSSPAMNGTTKEKCVAFFSEAGRVLMPDDTDDQVGAVAEHACGTSYQATAGAHMFDAAVSGPAHAAHAASVSAAALSNAKVSPPKPQADGEPDAHTTADNLGGDAATHAAPAGGLGVHA